ncbi:MAG: NADH-quinone oxidoreductase subunit A [Deltaproteobacteria bacterium RBG_13_53_10]|nr:MAG: NADH-quinone oxidoreductase subunit A [Deltaproteobacteria bacterium RBG_13_53_10]
MSPYTGTGTFSPWEPGILSFILYSFMALILVAALLFLAGWVGEKKRTPEKLTPYESGIVPSGPARFRYSVSFYLIAAFFLIFDVEGAYIFSWAIAFDQLGWSGWLQISFFIILLLVSLFYIWKKGGLEWGPLPKTDRNSRRMSS